MTVRHEERGFQTRHVDDGTSVYVPRLFCGFSVFPPRRGDETLYERESPDGRLRVTVADGSACWGKPPRDIIMGLCTMMHDLRRTGKDDGTLTVAGGVRDVHSKLGVAYGGGSTERLDSTLRGMAGVTIELTDPDGRMRLRTPIIDSVEGGCENGVLSYRLTFSDAMRRIMGDEVRLDADIAGRVGRSPLGMDVYLWTCMNLSEGRSRFLTPVAEMMGRFGCKTGGPSGLAKIVGQLDGALVECDAGMRVFVDGGRFCGTRTERDASTGDDGTSVFVDGYPKSHLVGVPMSERMVHAIDVAVGGRPRKRNDFIRQAVADRLTAMGIRGTETSVAGDSHTHSAGCACVASAAETTFGDVMFDVEPDGSNTYDVLCDRLATMMNALDSTGVPYDPRDMARAVFAERERRG